MMRRVGQLLAGAVLLVAAAGCGGDSDNDKGGGVPYGAQTCSDYVGRLSDGERWDAAEELLIQAKGIDGTDGDRSPATSSIEAFEQALGETCDRGSSDDLLATVADELYASNAAFYSY
ncbi:hypothetical protein C3492_10320 [Streptomyces sp. Ru62]|nr:hypothetical protein C3492_10320 [Streptomyces sp. Ru62]